MEDRYARQRIRADREFFKDLKHYSYMLVRRLVDAVTDQEQFLFADSCILCCSTIHSIWRFDIRMQVIFMEDTQIHRGCFREKNKQHLKVVLRHAWIMVQVRQQLHTLFRTLLAGDHIVAARISAEERADFLHIHL